MNIPYPHIRQETTDATERNGASYNLFMLRVGVGKRGSNGWDIYWVTWKELGMVFSSSCGQQRWKYQSERDTDGLIAWRIDHVPQNLFRILDAAPLWVAISQEDKLLLLTSPQALNAFLVHFDDTKTKRTTFQRDHKIRVVPCVRISCYLSGINTDMIRSVS